MSYDFEGHPKELLAVYDITKKLGSGAYGTVFNAVDKKTRKRMAIKRVQGVFKTLTHARRALREISIMRKCKHPNIVALKDVYALPSEDTFKTLWVVMEYGGTDVGKIIKHSKWIMGWNSLNIKHISWQILAGLNYLHSANVAHRDLKPENILVTGDSHVSLIDFGLARQLCALDLKKPDADKKDPKSPSNSLAMSRKLTQHVVTRWYRAPELILQQGKYSPAVDVWSFGCIFGELIKTLDWTSSPKHKPGALFPGRSSFPSSRDHYKIQDLKIELNEPSHQLNQIFNLIGTPAKDEIAKITRPDIRDLISKKPVLPAKDLYRVFCMAAAAIPILAESLKFDPDKRSPVAKLMVHPWFKDVVDPKKNLKSSGRMTFPFEDIPQLPDQKEEEARLRKLICKEIQIIRS